MKSFIRHIILDTQAVRIPLRFKKGILSILCFHGVTTHGRFCKTANFEGRHVHKDAFKDLLEYLLKRFNPITLEQLTDYYYAGKTLPENPLFITFDDGFANNYHHAFPVLKSLNCPAVIFLSTGYIENRTGFWVERLEYSIHNTKFERLRTSLLDHDLDLPLNSNEEKETAYRTILRFLKGGSRLSAIEEAVRLICDRLGFPALSRIDGNEDYRFLTWDEVKEMSAHGISFGAHTVHHVNLTFEDLEKARWETQASKHELESRLGRECIAFCYPYGRSGYNDKMEALLKESGFKLGFQLGGKLNDRDTNPMLLNRIPVGWGSRKEDLFWHILRS
ncbi:MAG: polysaccharide deacetylase family protein [Nitrospirae bacterium]|nr:polysaccharide deacetylase family protein [Nitrospirota bacterium]